MLKVVNVLDGGSLTGLFQIPDPNVAGNPQFQTGERLFRLTSSATNAVNPEPETFAHPIFSLLLYFSYTRRNSCTEIGIEDNDLYKNRF